MSGAPQLELLCSQDVKRAGLSSQQIIKTCLHLSGQKAHLGDLCHVSVQGYVCVSNLKEEADGKNSLVVGYIYLRRQDN